MYYLGTIAVGASGTSTNNWTGASGGTVFAIPPNVRALLLESNIANLQFELGQATGISFITTAVRGAFIPDANVAAGPFRVSPGTVTVAIFTNAGPGLVKVYAAPTS